MRRSKNQVKDKRDFHAEESEAGESGCNNVPYRSERQALDQIERCSRIVGSRQYPNRAYLCPHVACLRWHVTAKPELVIVDNVDDDDYDWRTGHTQFYPASTYREGRS